MEGEISNLARPPSGHLYFSLKDARAQVSCALFRNAATRLGFKPENGTQVLVRAEVSLYEARGNFQLIVNHMEEAGDGALRRALRSCSNSASSMPACSTRNTSGHYLFCRRALVSSLHLAAPLCATYWQY